MHRLKQYVVNFCTDEEGLTTVEYTIAGALVTLGIILAFTSLGKAITDSIVRLIS
ncbi:Flp family type IVb pilin [Photobacterium lipolyticum]|uniref:Flp family type IVb pilin n=1 Tax=Photobacterium lipolyticum TaxID=266810 RepID=A0A2T3MYU7_9GAMM|nr:Flp family type IVb pilin [Photobacterium lipolyticum]